MNHTPASSETTRKKSSSADPLKIDVDQNQSINRSGPVSCPASSQSIIVTPTVSPISLRDSVQSVVEKITDAVVEKYKKDSGTHGAEPRKPSDEPKRVSDIPIPNTISEPPKPESRSDSPNPLSPSKKQSFFDESTVAGPVPITKPITVHTDDEVSITPSPPKSIFDDHPPLCATASLSPPGKAPSPPPVATRTPISPEPPKLHPRKDKTNLRISVPYEEGTKQVLTTMPPSPLSPRSRGHRLPISPRHPPTRRVLSPQSRQLRKEKEDQIRKMSHPIEVIPLPVRKPDAPDSSDESDDESNDGIVIGRHPNVTRIKHESVGSLDKLYSDQPVFFGNDYPDDETPSTSRIDDDVRSKSEEPTERPRLVSFLYKKRPSEGDNSMFFSSSFVSPVSLDDSLFDLRNVSGGGTSSLMSSPVDKQTFAYRSGSASSLPKSDMVHMRSHPTSSTPTKKLSDSSSVHHLFDPLSLPVSDCDSSSMSDRDREYRSTTVFEASDVTTTPHTALQPYSRKSIDVHDVGGLTREIDQTDEGRIHNERSGVFSGPASISTSPVHTPHKSPSSPTVLSTTAPSHMPAVSTTSPSTVLSPSTSAMTLPTKSKSKKKAPAPPPPQLPSTSTFILPPQQPSELFSSQPSTSAGSSTIGGVKEGSAVPMLADKPGRKCGDLRVIEVLRVKILQIKGLKGSSKSPIFIVAKLDNKEIHQSCGFQRNAESVNDELSMEITPTRFTALHLVVLEGYKDAGKSARPVGMASIKRKELTSKNGTEMCLPLNVVSRCRDVQGQICLDIKRVDGRLWIKVIDYSDLDIKDKDSSDLYLLVTPDTKETKKLRIGPNRISDEWLEMKCMPNAPLHIKMTLWHDMMRGINAVFHGQVRVDLSAENVTQAPSKWFYLRSNDSEKKGGGTGSIGGDKEKKDKDASTTVTSSNLGEMRLWLSYTADHVLPMAVYEPLLAMIQESVEDATPFCVSLVALIEQIPQTDLSLVARPLVNIFAFSESIRPLLCKLFEYEIGKCQDMNTLFRSQSLAIKMMNELMRIYGHYYLQRTIKRVIDQIFNERACCEVDPSKLQPADNLEQNQENLVGYFATCFDRLVRSAGHCPIPLREIFCDLRNVVHRTTGKHEIEMLALSSFLIMRFFAPAILNPKSFGLKRDQPGPDSRVGRTLVLLSKMLQRLANCIVSTQPLISKEPWLEPLMTRVTTDEHKRSMCAYLERISCVDGRPDERLIDDDDVVHYESVAIVKEGTLVHHPTMPEGGKSTLRRIIGGSGKKKRHVVLTETGVGWQKARSDVTPRESIALCELSTIERTSKTVFYVKSARAEMTFEAATQEESGEWIACIKRQRERAMVRARPHDTSTHSLDIDLERELECVHTVLVEKGDTLTQWKTSLKANSPLPADAQPLPKNVPTETRTREQFIATLDQVLTITYGIEAAHTEAINRYKREMNAGRGTRENPIGGDEHYLIVKGKRATLL